MTGADTGNQGKSSKTAVLGASPKAERYSNMAIKRLKAHGHGVVPVNPAYGEIEGLQVAKRLDEIEPGSIDTVTVYISPPRSTPLKSEILRIRPRRVIFNPGTENPELEESLSEAGIEVVEGCTLVMLSTGSF